MNRLLIALIIGFLALVTFVCLIGDDTEQQLAQYGCHGAQASCSGTQSYGCAGASRSGCAGRQSAGCGGSGGQYGAVRGFLGRRPLRSFGGRLFRGCGG